MSSVINNIYRAAIEIMDESRFLKVLSQNSKMDQLLPYFQELNFIPSIDFWRCVRTTFELHIALVEEQYYYIAAILADKNSSYAQRLYSSVAEEVVCNLEKMRDVRERNNKKDEEECCDDEENLDTVEEVGESNDDMDEDELQLTLENDSCLGKPQINKFLEKETLESDAQETNEIAKNLVDLEDDITEIVLGSDMETKPPYCDGKFEMNDFFGLTELEQNLSTRDDVCENFIDLECDAAGVESEIGIKNDVMTKTSYHAGKIEIKCGKNLFHLNRLKRNKTRKSYGGSVRKSYRPNTILSRGKNFYMRNYRVMEIFVGIMDDSMMIRRDGLSWYVCRKRVRFRV